MKKIFIFLFFSLLVSESKAMIATDTIKYGNFGKIIIYRTSIAPNALVLFISGDGGWGMGVSKMSAKLVERGAMVAAIDIRYYFNNLKNSMENVIILPGISNC